MDLNKTILIIVKNFDGGTGIYVEQLLKLKNYFRHNKHLDIKVLLLQSPKFNLINDIKNDYITMDYKYPEYYVFGINTILLVIRELFFLYLKLKKIRPVIILSVDTHCNLLASFFKLFNLFKFSLILTLHNNIRLVSEKKLSKSVVFILRFMSPLFFNKADVILSPSVGLSNIFSHFFNLRKKVQTVPYGIEKSLIVKKIKKLKNDINIITIGRLEKQKDFKTLILAFSLLSKRSKHNNFKLTILGDGYNKRSLQGLVNNLKLSSKIIFKGWQKNVFYFLNKSNVFVFSSNWEGFGYVLIEAMSQGLPIISTDTPFGPREILDNGKYGILVPMKDPQAMAEAMQKLLTDKKLYSHYSKMSLERVKYFSEEKMLNKYNKLILNVMKDH